MVIIQSLTVVNPMSDDDKICESRKFSKSISQNYEELIRIGEKATGSKIKAIHKMLKDPLRKKVIQWPQKIYDELEKRGQQIFNAVSP